MKATKTWVLASLFFILSMGIDPLTIPETGIARLSSLVAEAFALTVHGAPEPSGATSESSSIGYAILIQGDSGGQYRDHYATSLDDIYKKLLRRSFTDDAIYYLSYSGAAHDTGITLDAFTSRQTIEYAITTWASTMISQRGIAPLYIVLMDHGSRGVFYLDPESITPDDLNGWITALETDIRTKLGQDLTTVIVNGSCYSGSFIPKLSKQGRIVLTSSTENEQSSQGPVSNNKTYGEYFVYYLFGELAAGKNLQDAFKEAAKVTQQMRNCQGWGCAKNSVDSAGDTDQNPLLDDNGDGLGSGNAVGKGDGALASGLYLGYGINPEPLSIKSTTSTTKLKAGTTSLPASTKICNTGRQSCTKEWVKDSWVEVRKPSYVAPDSGGTGQVLVDLPKVSGSYNAKKDEWEYPIDNLTEAGIYTLSYYATDLNGDVLPPVMETLYIDAEGNDPPESFALIEPVDRKEILDDAMMIFRWETAVDPNHDPVTYTLKIYESLPGNNGDSLIKCYERIPQEFFIINGANEKRSDGTDLFVWGNTYLWEVEAVDDKGASVSSARNPSQRWSFKVRFTNAISGVITGIIYSDLDYSRITTASLTATINGAEVIIPITNGSFAYSATPDTTLTLAGGAEGYQTPAASDVKVLAGEVTTLNIAMSTVGPATYSITATFGENGMIVCDPASVSQNSGTACSITANPGYALSTLMDNGFNVTSQVTNNGYQLSNIAGHHQIAATFGDITKPVGSVSIAGGAYASDRTVILTLSATDTTGIEGMRFSRDGGVTWGAEEPYGTTKSWNLDAPDGWKTVHVQFKDTAGNWSEPYAASITLDTTSPVTTASPAGGTYATAQCVTLSANEERTTIYYTTDGSPPSESSSVYGGPISIPISAPVTLKFLARDAVGNLESVKTETYSFDARGDLDGSGKVDLADAILALQVTTETMPVMMDLHLENDVDGDKMIGIAEVIYIMQKIAGRRAP